MIEPIHFIVEKSEEYFKTVVDSSFNGIAVVDENGNFEYMNESFLKMIGWLREELIGENFIKIIPDDMHESALKICSEVQAGVNNNQEIQIKTRSGKLKYLNSFHKLTKINGQLKTVCITEDITEKKILEQKLAESETRYRNFFDNASDSIYCYDSGGYFLDANKTALELLGCTKDELIGTHISEWITPQSLKTTQEDLKKRIGGEPGKDVMVLDVIDKKGEHHCMEIRRRITRQGDKIIVHGIGRDITEKIKMQRELKESEVKYRELFENAQDAMYVLDTEGNFLKMNKTGLRILGCTEEEVIGSNLSKWLTQESLKIVENRRKKCRSGEMVNQTDTLELVCKNGEHRWVEIKIRHIKDGDRTTEIHGIARDITEKMRLRQELIKSNKQKKLLCYLIEGTRGGKTRALILKQLIERPFNAHQLAKALNMDYKTVRHHLGVLVKNGIITRGSDGYMAVYSISKDVESNLNDLTMDSSITKSVNNYSAH